MSEQASREPVGTRPSITAELLRIVEVAHSPTGVLEGAVRMVAQRLAVDACWAFLLDGQSSLLRAAHFGAEAPSNDDETAAARAASSALSNRRTLVLDQPPHAWLVSPMILRERLVGALVLRVTGRGYSADDIATLTTMAAQLVSVVENARIVEALARGASPLPRGAAAPLVRADTERVLVGVAASPGLAIGTALFRGAYRLELPGHGRPMGDPVHEQSRAREAISKAHNDLLHIQREAAREIDEEHALIFASQLLLLNDPTLLEHIAGQIAGGVSAPAAVGVAFDELERRLRLIPDAYIREKIEDVDDLRGRLLDHMLGGSRPGLATEIVVSNGIPPSLVVEIKTQGAQALVTETGGATSHGVLLARAMGIPVVSGIADLVAQLRSNDSLVVDGIRGLVVVNPTEETRLRYVAERQSLQQARTEHAKYRTVLASTADGARVSLYANVGVASDLVVARENGAEGVGLYRTEFPFIVRDAFPTRDEQVRIYAKAYELFPDGPIQFRILDLAGDKFVASGAFSPARSAFHGYRSIRVLFDHPEVLRDQVQALAIAARDRPLRILIPMLTSLEELRRIRAMITAALSELERPTPLGVLELGAMIEVPAAVELAEEIAREVDFLSIGTNDLMQYSLVVDREDARMAPLSDPYHPAILRMIARVAAAGAAAGKKVGVCGELALRPDLALAMIALGIDSLSVVPTAIPELKQALAGMQLSAMKTQIAGILRLSDAATFAAALKAV
jgi:phosphotransferase system, enzyme I, PtsP